MKVKFYTSLNQVDEVSKEEKEKLKPITEKYVFRANDYYLSLIDWDNPKDPIRRIIIPNTNELNEYGEGDASDEAKNYVVPGCQ